MSSTPIYSLRAPDVYKALETSPEGLPAIEAESRRSLYGSNLLSEQIKVSPWEKLAGQFTHPVASFYWLSVSL